MLPPVYYSEEAEAEASGSGTVSPPRYTVASTSGTFVGSSLSRHVSDEKAQPRDDYFDIVPQADQTSFQVGYLGLDRFQAWIKGEVLLKLDERTRTQQQHFHRCSITLSATESDDEQAITLFSATQVLWERTPTVQVGAGDSSLAEGSSRDRLDSPPTTMPFSVPLTNDLPHCIHLPHSSLQYDLIATLESEKPMLVASATKKVSVHITRYSRPEALLEAQAGSSGKEVGSSTTAGDSLSPYCWSVDSPTPMYAQLQRTLFRRAEPIVVHVRIPPPQERRLLSIGLRSVEANLIRVITNRRTGVKHELLLAHSGKLCRLHSTRSIVLRLALHPPFDVSNMPYPHPDHDAAQGGPIHGRGGGGGCESVTQETVLHDVVFKVSIRIAIRGDEGSRRDIHLETPVTILPGAAGTDGVASKQLDDSEGTAQPSAGTSAKAQEAASYASAGPSTSSMHAIDDAEEEYDGYEDVGRPLTLSDDEDGSIEILMSRSHDNDVPPPTVQESQNDLQVEVEVEGVGAGVLRDTGSAPDLPGGYTWRREEIDPGSEGEASEYAAPSPDGDVGTYDEQDSPPSFQVVTDEQYSSLGGASYGQPSTTGQPSAASYTNLGGSGTTSAATHRPPPYGAESMRVPRSSPRTPPRLPERITSVQPAGSDAMHVATGRSSLPPSAGHSAAASEEEARPPAYPSTSPTHFTAQFPPRYEA